MFEVSKKFSFEAAHSLPYLPEGHKCRRLHGHSYTFEVMCTGDLDERDFVVDYMEISTVADRIVSFLDHTNLNEVFEFKTTAENICKWIYEEMNKSIKVHQVVLSEMAETKVKYPV